MATKEWKLIGLDKVIKNLNKEIAKINHKTKKGLLMAALMVKGASMRKTPRDTGNLVNSHFVVMKGGAEDPNAKSSGDFRGDDAAKVRDDTKRAQEDARYWADSRTGMQVAVIGVGAAYAVYVHERMDVSHAKFDKGSGNVVEVGEAKFLENAFREQGPNIIAMIKQEVKV